MSAGYFFMGDLLGFGNIIRNSSATERLERIDRWLALVDNSARAESLDQIQLISDTVFAASGDSVDGLRRLVRFAQRLLNEGVHASLPIRGAICHGEYVWGRLTYGKAVVDAYDLERAQNWIGVTCQSGLPHLETLWGYGSVLTYAAPFKSGPMMARPVVDWEIPPASQLLNLLGREGLAKDGDVFTWSLGEKLNNTIEFAIYKHLAQQRGFEAKSFWSPSLELTENAVGRT